MSIKSLVDKQMKDFQHRNLLQWRAARAKYEYRLRQGSLMALSYAQKCCGSTINEATADIESVIQFKLKEWEQRNPKPAN